MSDDSVGQLTSALKDWFNDRSLNAAIVGYSGGVDSACTIALLSHAKIETHLVVAEAPGQKYSSPLGGVSGAQKFLRDTNLDAEIHAHRYAHIFESDSANEAAAPIHRVAIFYGVAAALRDQNKRPVVVGTANFDEAAYLGFWGKSSDGAQDLYPISSLHKSDVVKLARELGVSSEIIRAKPSGDLLFKATNDLSMIGADYDLIEELGKRAEAGESVQALREVIERAPSPARLKVQILSNRFKYQLPFPGFHLSARLEDFRRRFYENMVEAAALAEVRG